VAFPCNQFGKQEPGSNEEIKSFAASKDFPGLLMDKIEVNGPNESPVYTYLKEASGNAAPIGWNFDKFLVAKDGSVALRSNASAGSLAPQLKELAA